MLMRVGFELSGLAIFVMPVLAAFSIILAKDKGLCDRSRPDEVASLCIVVLS